MGINYELANSTSRDLALAIYTEMGNEEHDQPPTLGSLLQSMQQGLYRELVAAKRIAEDAEQTLLHELEALVGYYGDDMPAEHFVEYGATNDLAAVLNYMLISQDPEQPPTLGTLRMAILDGIATHLAACGELDHDESAHLIDEVDDLIRLHGADTPAEYCLL